MATTLIGTTNSNLARAPYYSRFTQFEGSESNYNLIGFTPGLALQAAELNELQENFLKVTTLSNLMISNWTLKCIKVGSSALANVNSFLWNGAVPLDPAMVSNNNNTITLNIGWYYITDQSGLKYWTYLKTNQNINTSSSTTGFISFGITIQDIFSNTDNRLYDNSAGSSNTNSPGSYRISQNIIDSTITPSTSDTSRFYILQKTASNTFNWLNGITL